MGYSYLHNELVTHSNNYVYHYINSKYSKLFHLAEALTLATLGSDLLSLTGLDFIYFNFPSPKLFFTLTERFINSNIYFSFNRHV